MSENEGVRIASMFVVMLLCTGLTQTACAAWNVVNWNPNAEYSTVLNTTTENKAVENETVEKTTGDLTDGSFPSSDLFNNPVQSDNLANFPKLSNLMSGSILQNGIQFPKIQRR